MILYTKIPPRPHPAVPQKGGGWQWKWLFVTPLNNHLPIFRQIYATSSERFSAPVLFFAMEIRLFTVALDR